MCDVVDIVQLMSTMRITAAGQLSLPADIRRRWNVSRVRLVDHGDHVTLEPIPDDVLEATFGRFASATSTEALRATARADEARDHAREGADRAGVRRVSTRGSAAG